MKCAIKAIPKLGKSQLSFRIGLARERTQKYPMDDMNFIMMDLERPEQSSRHAHWCDGDLSGRTLEFLSSADGIDGIYDERLPELFTRILNNQRKCGMPGKYLGNTTSASDRDTGHIAAGTSKILPGLMRYYRLTKDSRALDAACCIADIVIGNQAKIEAACKKGPETFITWIFEAFAFLYKATMDEKYLEFFQSLSSYIPAPYHVHSHSFLTTLRGVQAWSITTGNKQWNEQVEAIRKRIIEEEYEMADGGIAEVFPRSFRNEGCSVGDWLMVNLNAGFLNQDDSAYETAENILWNALYFNQFITGGFGHRDLTPNGYGDTGVSEAWWCCTENCGIAMTEFARHVVTYADGVVSVNFLIPGSYTIPMEGEKDITIHITTTYPASFEGFIQAENLPEHIKVKIRVPSFVKNSSIIENRASNHAHIRIKGDIGHYITEKEHKVVLKYGPLVLSPSVYYWGDHNFISKDNNVPAGYIPSVLPGTECTLLCKGYDENGFLKLDSEPLPDWSYFEEGNISRTAVKGASVNVLTEFDNKERFTLRFTPLCYNISNLSLYPAPILFRGLKLTE